MEKELHYQLVRFSTAAPRLAPKLTPVMGRSTISRALAVASVK